MIEIETKLRRMGNSLGIFVPAEIISSKGLRVGEKLNIHIEEKGASTVGNMLKEARKQKLKFKRSTQEILDEIDRELD